MIEYRVVSPFPADHLPKMWEWLQEFKCFMVNDAAPQSYEQMVEGAKRDGKSYAIVGKDGVPVGAVWGDTLADGIFAGHLVFDRYSLSTADKMKYTREALLRFFSDGARKISWSVFADNRPFSIFLRRVGAKQEGVFRKATRRGGELVDVAVFATFPEDI